MKGKRLSRILIGSIITIQLLLIVACKDDCTPGNAYYPLRTEDTAIFPFKGTDSFIMQLSDSNGNHIDTFVFVGQGKKYGYVQINEENQCIEDQGEYMEITYKAENCLDSFEATVLRGKVLSRVFFSFSKIRYISNMGVFNPPYTYDKLTLAGHTFYNITQLCGDNTPLYNEKCDELPLLVNQTYGLLKIVPDFNRIFTRINL